MPFDISVVLVSYNTAHLLKQCIDALRASMGALRYEIVIVDNASVDNSVSVIKRDFPNCKLIVNAQNVGFGRANNQALEGVTGRYVLLLNTDAFVAADTLGKTLGYMDTHPECGILGARLIGRDTVLQPSARYFPTPWNVFLQRTGLSGLFPGVQMVDDMGWDHASIKYCDWVPGCYYLVRKQVIDDVGLFDPRYFLYYEEVDHCFSAKKAGWKVVCYAETTVIHIGGESAKSASNVTQVGRQIESLQVESELLYFRKNLGVAGACLSVALTVLGDAVIVLKRLLRGKFPTGASSGARHISLVWNSFRRTAWGTRATR